MTRIIVDIPKAEDVPFILELLERLEARVLRQEDVSMVEDPATFYSRFHLDLSDYKFDRDEANER